MKVSICFYKKNVKWRIQNRRGKMQSKAENLCGLYSNLAQYFCHYQVFLACHWLLKTNNKINWPKKITSHADFLWASSLVSIPTKAESHHCLKHNLFSRKNEPFRRGKTTHKLAKGCTSEKFSLKDISEPLKKPEQVEAMYGCIVRNKARN